MYTSSWGGIMKKKTNKNDTRFQEPIPYQEPMFLTIVREGVWTIRAKPIIGDHNTSFGTRVADSFLFFFVFVFVSFSIMRSFPLTLLGVVLCCVVLGGVAGEASYWDFWSNGVRDSSGCNYGPFLNQVFFFFLFVFFFLELGFRSFLLTPSFFSVVSQPRWGTHNHR